MLLEALEPRLLLAGARQATVDFVAVADTPVSAQPASKPGNFYVGDWPREEAFRRFDLSAWRGTVERARLRLVPADGHAGAGQHTLQAVADDSWPEATMRWQTRPVAEAPLATWSPVPSTPVELDVTRLVKESLAAGDALISLAVTGDGRGSRVRYYSREHFEPSLRPHITLEGSGENTAPHAADDRYVAINDGTPLTVPSALGLLANDADADGDALRVGRIVNLRSTGNLFGSRMGRSRIR